MASVNLCSLLAVVIVLNMTGLITAAPSNFLLSRVSGLQDRYPTYNPSPNFASQEHITSVHHFARHGLCSSPVKRQRFAQIIFKRLCSISESFAVEIVSDLCTRKDKMLDEWAAQLFDIDSDGQISTFERRMYDS